MNPRRSAFVPLFGLLGVLTSIFVPSSAFGEEPTPASTKLTEDSPSNRDSTMGPTKRESTLPGLKLWGGPGVVVGNRSAVAGTITLEGSALFSLGHLRAGVGLEAGSNFSTHRIAPAALFGAGFRASKLSLDALAELGGHLYWVGAGNHTHDSTIQYGEAAVPYVGLRVGPSFVLDRTSTSNGTRAGGISLVASLRYEPWSQTTTVRFLRSSEDGYDKDGREYKDAATLGGAIEGSLLVAGFLDWDHL